MKINLLLILFILVYQFSYSQDHFLRTENGTIKFKSEAPLELIRAESNNLHGILDISKREFAFRVTISSFQGFNSTLQRIHFQENYMEIDDFPNATFIGRIIENIQPALSEQSIIRAKGKLTIHGITKDEIIKVSLTKTETGLYFESEMNIVLEDYEIEVPRIVRQKIASVIDVSISGILMQ